MDIIIKSPAFGEGQSIPEEYTCDGMNISPPLEWSNIPSGVVSLAIIFDDPDAPAGTWVHWVIYNIPSSERKISKGVPLLKELENGAVQGINSFGRTGYGGPCPPGGTHRYYFKIYALDTKLPSDPKATKESLLKAMSNHILTQGQLMGRYSRR
jgi:hypothetical protein